MRKVFNIVLTSGQLAIKDNQIDRNSRRMREPYKTMTTMHQDIKLTVVHIAHNISPSTER